LFFHTWELAFKNLTKAESISVADGLAEEIYCKFLKEYLGANLVLGFMKFVAHYSEGFFCLQNTLRRDISLF